MKASAHALKGNILSVDSFNNQPYKSLDSVAAASKYQIDYITFSGAKTAISGLDIGKYLKDKVLAIEKITLNRPAISVYRDVLPPFEPGIRKKFFVENAREIPVPLLAKEIEISDGHVTYIEKNAKNRLEGKLFLTNVQGSVLNFKNHGLLQSDSLSVTFNGRLQDAGLFVLKIKQSYLDTSYGFVMNLKIEPFSLTQLNGLLAPLSNVKFKSAVLNKLEMNATGNENVANGWMKFYYEDMHIKLLKNGGTEKSGFVRDVATGLVNALLIKK